jgi:hypothetical protein
MNRTIRGVDYSFARPNLKKLHDLGYRFVGRYVTGRGKALTRDELKAIHAAGLALGPLYFEAGGNRARSGWGDGTRDPNAEVLQDPPITVAGGDVDVLHADASAFAAFRGGWRPEPPPPPRKYASRTLAFGAKGADVRELQRILSTISAPYINQDGDYGHETEDAKQAAITKLGWPDKTIRDRAHGRDIGVEGQRYLQHPDTRPKAYKGRERKRAGR